MSGTDPGCSARELRTSSIQNAFNHLERSINKLEDLTFEVESGASDVKEGPNQPEPQTPSLSHLLDNAPTWIETQTDRINGAIDRLRGMLI